MMLSYLKEYYREFWDRYRLLENLQIVENFQKKKGTPARASGKKVMLIVVNEGHVDLDEWIHRAGLPVRWIERVVFLNRRHSQKCSDGFEEIVLPRPFVGEDINRLIRETDSDIIFFVRAELLISPSWLENLVSAFDISRGVRCAVGNVTLLGAPSLFFCSRSSFLQFWGVAFTKKAWAMAGGFPSYLPLHTSWMIFTLRLKSLSGECVRFYHAESWLHFRWRSFFRLLETSFQEGEVGLFIETLGRGFISRIGAILLGLGGCDSFLPAEIVPFLRDRLIIGVFSLFYLIGYSLGIRNRKSVRREIKKEHELRLKEIVDSKGGNVKGIIVYLSTHDWKGMFQRPQQMAEHLSEIGYLIFYYTRNEQEDAVVGFQEVKRNLFVCAVPLETFAVLDSPILIIGTSWYAPILEWFVNPIVVYDYFDNLEVSSGLLENHERLLREAEIVLASSRRLLDSISGTRPDTIYVPNAVDYEFIQGARPKDGDLFPEDLRSLLEMGNPIIGYIGALARWFDYNLVASVADSHPEWVFVLVGVDYDGSLAKSGLLSRSNVVWLGWKPYKELFNYVWKFNVGIIPFVLTEVTMDASPIKLFEYFACGKPVVSTPLPECLGYPEVFVASDEREFSVQIRKALDASKDLEYLSRIDRIARENTWQDRVLRLDAAIEKVRPAFS